MLTIKSTSRVGHKVTSTISATNDEGADGGGNYTCTPVNAEEAGESSYVVLTVIPDVGVEPPVLTVLDGKLASCLHCVTNAYPQPTITWKKNGATISFGIVDYVYNVTNQFGNALSIGKVSLSDNETVFTCEVRQGSFVIRKSSILIVEYDVTLTLSPQSVIGVVGDEVTFTCKAEGRAAEIIQWTADGINVHSSSVNYNISEQIRDNMIQSQLAIRRLELFHGTQEYRCNVGTKANPHIEVTDAATISVLGEISRFRNMAYDISVASDEPFSCLFTANPQPDVSLQLDDMTVAGTSTQSTGSYGYNISLPIKALDVNSAGIYSCIVKYPGSSVNLSRTARLQITMAADSGSSDEKVHIIGAAVAVGIVVIVFQVFLFAIWRYKRGRNASSHNFDESESDKDTTWVSLRHPEAAEGPIVSIDLVLLETNCAYDSVNNEQNTSHSVTVHQTRPASNE